VSKKRNKGWFPNENSYKGPRDLYGEKNPSAILTAKQVREIRWRKRFTRITNQELADEYGIKHGSTISNIVNRKRWGHIK